ncbi:MAG: NFACT family protein [Acidobacteriota bacterium]|nr:NFACT family protein [Blastocatellia bacterium]MDW8413783.1 NFACT family protein [Acidobacteriota bacterium]
MPLDDRQLELICQEIQSTLLTSKIKNVYEPDDKSFTLALSSGPELYVFPARQILFVGQLQKRYGQEKTHFCSLLRKHLEGRPLEAVIKPAATRVVELLFPPYSLLIELTGRSYNAHLYSDKELLASLRTGFLQEPVLPSASGKITIETTENITLSPLLRKELAFRTESQDPQEALFTLLEDLKNISPRVYYDKLRRPAALEPGKTLLLASFELKLAAKLESKSFATMNEAAQFYYELSVIAEEHTKRRQSYLSALKTEIARLERLVDKLTTELAEYEKSEEYKKQAELIIANLSNLKKSGNKLHLIDFYDPNLREIELEIEPQQTAQQAAEQLFKRYRRSTRGRKITLERLSATQTLLLEKSRQYQLAMATSELPIEISNSTSTSTSKPTNRQRKTSPTPHIRKYISSEGFEILVGKSDLGNEELLKIARPQDIWLHAADYPGSHVLVRNPSKQPVPQKTLYEAAQLAAYFSKAKGETTAAVRYCERKMLSKPKKAKPGTVLLHHYRTLIVPPKEPTSCLP